MDADAVAVRETDPMRVDVTVPDVDRPLLFGVDESFDVVDRENC